MGRKNDFLRSIKYALLFSIAFAIAGWGLYTAIAPNVELYKKEQGRSKVVQEYRKENELNNSEMWVQVPIEIKPTEATPEEWPELWETLSDYNEQIYADGQADLSDPFSYAEITVNLSEYGYDSEIFGIVSIPKLNVELPIYLGASERNMDSGAAQMTETSMPIGGANTNSVFAVHRNYIMEVEELELGDVILVQNPWEVLEYRVVQIKLIWPNEIEHVMIQEGRDLITIMTCHPWGSGGRYRYIVTAERCKEEVEAGKTIQVSLLNPIRVKEQFEKMLAQWSNKQNADLEISEGTEFTSSRRDILIRKNLPLAALCAAAVIGVILILTPIIRLVIRKTKNKKSK